VEERCSDLVRLVEVALTGQVSAYKFRPPPSTPRAPFTVKLFPTASFSQHNLTAAAALPRRTVHCKYSLFTRLTSRESQKKEGKNPLHLHVTFSNGVRPKKKRQRETVSLAGVPISHLYWIEGFMSPPSFQCRKAAHPLFSSSSFKPSALEKIEALMYSYTHHKLIQKIGTSAS